MTRDEEFGLKMYLEAKFESIDHRLDRIENAGPRAGMWGGIGTMLGAVVVTIFSFFGGSKQ